MTNGPAAKIGEVMEIPFSRPRDRDRIMEDPNTTSCNRALDFLYHRFAHDDVEADRTATGAFNPCSVPLVTGSFCTSISTSIANIKSG